MPTAPSRILAFFSCFLIFSGSALAADITRIKSEYIIIKAITDKSYEDVSDEIEFAITERNFRITGKNIIGKAIRKRGHKAFPNVDVVHFCNVENAREVLEHDINFVSQMPCRMTVHEEQGKVVVQLILVPEQHPDPAVRDFAKRMNKTLQEILAFVLEDDSPVMGY